jgi:exodeoxyribonuclease-3
VRELKAEASQIPDECKLPDYHAYWHCRKAYSGVSLLVRKDLVAADPVYRHPPFDVESRIVQVEHGDLVIASVYVPNGGKDYAAKLSFLTRMTDWARRLHAEGRALLLCGDINIARTEMDVHPRERKPNAVGQRPDERALFETLLGTGLADLGRVFDPGNPGLFTWWAPWRNLRARNVGWPGYPRLTGGGAALAAWCKPTSAPVITPRCCCQRLRWSHRTERRAVGSVSCVPPIMAGAATRAPSRGAHRASRERPVRTRPRQEVSVDPGLERAAPVVTSRSP